ncbi:MAG: hypothetical protein GPOALKHO_000335 [Sodalis sp.]|uniref:hypothetical protein n=1 Tax=Sodalis sp. (in: enterobacteria) TaxID=1898979 RepID=UPI00387308F2|nr:MAG: hypothetical protein GPOALKHO_000335 [Sodalis sp.]
MVALIKRLYDHPLSMKRVTLKGVVIMLTPVSVARRPKMPHRAGGRVLAHASSGLWRAADTPMASHHILMTHTAAERHRVSQ